MNLTILDLMSLIVAIPATILYKIFFKDAPYTQAQVKQIVAAKLPWPSAGTNGAQTQADNLQASGGDIAISIIYLLACIVYAVFDVALDVTAAGENSADMSEEPEVDLDPAFWPSAMAIVLSVIIQLVGAPYSSFNSSREDDEWVVNAWGVNWIVVGFDSLALLFQQKAVRFAGKLGPIMSTAFGVVSVGISAKAVATINNTADTSYTKDNKVELLIGQWPFVFQWIVLLGLDSIPTGIANAGLALVDIVSDAGLGIAKMSGTSKS